MRLDMHPRAVKERLLLTGAMSDPAECALAPGKHGDGWAIPAFVAAVLGIVMVLAVALAIIVDASP